MPSSSSSKISSTTTSNTKLYESFGLGLGEDSYENQPDLLRGEQEYKQYVNRISEENMLNRKVCKRRKIKSTVNHGFYYEMFT